VWLSRPYGRYLEVAGYSEMEIATDDGVKEESWKRVGLVRMRRG